MSIVDHEGAVEYPFSQKTVFDAALRAAKKMESFTLDSADELSGRIVLKAGVSLVSWGENIPIQLIKEAPTRTLVKIMSSPKTGVLFGGVNDFGKNRRNIEKIISAISAELENVPSENASSKESSTSKIDAIVKLKELLDSGALTQEEFDVQKKKLLEDDNLQQEESKVVVVASNNVQAESTQKGQNTPVKIESTSSDTSLFVWLAIGVIAFVIISMLLSM